MFLAVMMAHGEFLCLLLVFGTVPKGKSKRLQSADSWVTIKRAGSDFTVLKSFASLFF